MGIAGAFCASSPLLAWGYYVSCQFAASPAPKAFNTKCSVNGIPVEGARGTPREKRQRPISKVACVCEDTR